MKKLLSALLCIVFICFSLVGCAEDVIGEYLENYNTNKNNTGKIETLNFYIITSEMTSEQAKITVPQNINTYIKEKYKLELNITYLTADKYVEAVNTALKNTDESKRPDIVLINGKSTFDELYENDNLVMLNDMYSSRDYKSINTIVDDVLLAASAVVDSTTGESSYYTVPNNHIIGTYKYAVINKEVVRNQLHYSEEKIHEMSTEEKIDDLIAEVKAYLGTDDVSDYVRYEDGYFNDKAVLEDSGKNYVNIISMPSATKEEAHESAFAIIKHLDDKGAENSEEKQALLNDHYSKCMSIIFALNTDAQLKNMLQYGYVGTNYKIDTKKTNTINLLYDSAEKESDDMYKEVTYIMNPIYTGNIFISYYCDDIVLTKNGMDRIWNSDFSAEITKQNSDAIIP